MSSSIKQLVIGTVVAVALAAVSIGALGGVVRSAAAAPQSIATTG